MKDGGPAFPQPCTDQGYAANTPYDMAGGGMSLRDYFAAKAMQGLIPEILKHISDVNEPEQVPTAVAQTAYEFADAMIAERGREQH